MLPISHSRSRAHRAAATAEMAMLTPFLCFCLMITIDYGRIFYYSIVIENCARNGAVYGSQGKSYALDTTNIKAQAQLDATTDVDLTQWNASSTTDSSTSPTWVEVTVTYTFTTLINYPGIPSSTTISRKVRMSVVPATPYSSS